MWFWLKLVLSAAIISGASWLSGKKPSLAGFLISLPLVSMLSLLFSYMEYKDEAKVEAFAKSIFVLVPLSLFFFAPFLLNKWLHLNFYQVYFLGILCLAAAYGLFRLLGGVI
jgi:hypothetical protein